MLLAVQRHSFTGRERIRSVIDQPYGLTEVLCTMALPGTALLRYGACLTAKCSMIVVIRTDAFYRRFVKWIHRPASDNPLIVSGGVRLWVEPNHMSSELAKDCWRILEGVEY